MRAYVDYVKSCPRVPGVDEILVPGEYEANAKRERSGQGIFLSDDTWGSIAETAESLGVKIPQ